jgi:peptidyl-prolyl cis-trans isomerase C
MKYLFLPLSLFALAAFAQAPAAAPKAPALSLATNVPPETVVAKVGDKPMTAAEIRKLMSTLPSDLQQAFLQNPKNAMQSLFLLDYLTKEAEKSNLANTSPYKEQLAMQRMQVLAQAEVSRRSEQVVVTDAELQKRYDADKSKFDSAKIRAIYIGFTDPKNPPKAEKGEAPAKTLTEAEAKAKADSIVKQARTGGDFAELAKNNSDDKGTAVKGGDYGTMRRGDKIPEDIKTAIFALKAGEVSEPLHQPNGFFIVKADERGVQPFKDVQPQLASELKQERFNEWMKALQKQFEVTIENDAFFGAKPPAAVTPATPLAK